MTKELAFGIFQFIGPSGVTVGSWAHPDNEAPLNFLDIDHWTRLAARFEEAKIDFIFFADAYSYATLDGAVIPNSLEDAVNSPNGDPMTIVSALAAATENLGFVVTSSTTVEKPQQVARRYGTLDHFTKGRIGWNIVTGSGQAASAKLFGEEMIAHDRRYEMAEDHVQLSLKLWEGSWEEDALRIDKEARVYADPAKVHEIDHDGPFFKAHGMLAVPPSPQRTPMLLQAGTSRQGKALAAKYAEMVFLAGGDPAHVAANIRDIRRLAVEQGRSADDIKFVIGALFVVAPTHEEAVAKREEMLSLTTIEGAATAYAYYTGIDLLKYDLDSPLPKDMTTEQGRSSVERFLGENAPTVREILDDYRRNGVNGTAFVGDPVEVADQVQAFVEQTDADGFLVQPYLTPGTYDDFIDLLLPQLRARGLAKIDYQGRTLREHVFGEGRARLEAPHPAAAYRAPARATAIA